MIPSQVASATYSISDMDSRIVLYLRQFKRNHQHPFAGTHEYMKRIRDVRPGDYFDCYCKASFYLARDFAQVQHQGLGFTGTHYHCLS